MFNEFFYFFLQWGMCEIKSFFFFEIGKGVDLGFGAMKGVKGGEG